MKNLSKYLPLVVTKSRHTDPTSTPLIFKTKQKRSEIKTLEFINNDTGQMKHYPPAAQEWYNSIYTYNHNYIRSLPVLDKSLKALLESYSNMSPRINIDVKKIVKRLKLYIKKNNLKGTQKKLVYAELRNIPKRFLPKHKRLSARKVFVGRGDLKHTSSKVIITLYTYNLLKTFLLRKIKRYIHLLYFPQRSLVLYITKDLLDPEPLSNKKRNVISYNRPLSLDEFLFTPGFNPEIVKTRVRLLSPKTADRVTYHDPKDRTFWVTFYEAYLSFIIQNVEIVTKKLSKINRYYIFLTKLYKKNLIPSIGLYFTPLAAKFKYSKYNKRFSFSIYRARKLYLSRLLLYSWTFYSFNVRFKNPFVVSKLKSLVKNLYGKDVEFNVVELKKMHLSSDIFTQAVALKLKNRDNKLYRVLRSSLTRVPIQNERRDSEGFNKFKKEEYIVNRIRNTSVSTMFDKNTLKNLPNNPKNLISKDSLNNLLLYFFPSANTLEDEIKKRFSVIKLPISINNYVLKNLKHLKLSGVRVEAKGRLTRRFTAQRSVFKLKYKGGLKNVDSSFRNLSAVMLRGIVKSNVQYSAISSKNRVGAYGVKGWVANK